MYVAVSALVPVMLRAHERARVLTPLVLLAAVVAVDVTRLSTGVDAIGFLNLLLVWLLVQQLGFHLADGGVDGLGRGALVGIAGGALAFLAVLTVVGPYPVDMLVNLNPPTVCLVVLGVAQLALFQLARPRIRAWVERADASRRISFVGERAMTVYLWHMPVLIVLAGLSLVANSAVGMPLPEPLTAAWWATRPLWLGVAAAAVVPVVLAFARFERPRRGRDRVGRRRPRHPSARPRSTRSAASPASRCCSSFGFGPVPAGISLALLLVALVGSLRMARAVRAVGVVRHRRDRMGRRARTDRAGRTRAPAASVTALKPRCGGMGAWRLIRSPCRSGARSTPRTSRRRPRGCRPA